MNILITGASGFIGSRLVSLADQLFSKDDKLILLTSKPIEGFICISHNNYSYTIESFEKNGILSIDVVIHIGHYLAELHPNESVSLGNISSINNTVHLINNLPTIPKVFVFCSSMAVYGTNREDKINEFSKTNPDNAYAISKLMIEEYLKEWASANDVMLHILRLPHIYGPRDKRNYTIPIWLKASMRGMPIRVFSNPYMNRNCVYIDDCCRYIAKASSLMEDVKIINAVSEYNSTLQEIAMLCGEVSNNTFPVEVSDEYDHNAVGICFENANLRKIYLGDEMTSLRQGLRIEYEYYTE